MPGYYPPGSFYFSLAFTDIKTKADAAFQEVTGMESELDTEEVTCGGENRFRYKLPSISKSGNLKLKRGFITSGSTLANWCSSTLNGGLNTAIAPKTITVNLLDNDGNVLNSWDFLSAYPVKWGVSDFKSTDNAYVIESIEFAYTYFKQTS
jgi:phage tail-like protein